MNISMQPASLDIWASKYQLKNLKNEPVDESPEASFRRVAKALAMVEKTPELQAEWEEAFFWAMQHGAIPAGRILSNAGAEQYKPATSTINCTVSATIPDSMEGILMANVNAGLTLKAGCGVGYEFSTLRPKGAFVAGAGATTSGPLSFMEIFDRTCLTVSSAGGRRGAQMATFDIHHPDVMDFIKAKRKDGHLRQFNLSLLITDKFIEAVKQDADWQLSFPVSQAEIEQSGIDIQDSSQVVWREFPVTTGYITNDRGEVACRIYSTVKAQKLWNLVMSSTYDFAEPGFILIDRVNEQNNNWFCENIRASNPCGEQMLPPDGSCLLGSVNLVKFINNPFTPEASFDEALYCKVVKVFTRMLDNVCEVNGLPLEGQRQEMARKRRHGMGYLGLGSAMVMLGMTYGDEASVAFTERVSELLAIAGWEAGVELAKEKGEAPVLTEKFVVTSAMLAKRPEMVSDGFKVDDKIAGRILLTKYSRYMQRLGESHPKLIKSMLKHGVRFTHHTSIAPTGTIALSLANNVSNGIEPSFAHKYSRNVIRPDRKTKEKVDVFSFELLAYRHEFKADAEVGTDLPPAFIQADTVSPLAHVDVQAAAQKWVDASISKTINVAADIPYESFKDVYLYAHEKGLKGCTTFRFNPEAFQGVLVKDEDLANTTYTFTLQDGSTVDLKGNDMVEYDGEMHTAANLYDALKEGYYGR